MKQKKGTQWVPKKQEDPGLLARLSRPTGPVDVVLDTDTYNEIDDQFAVSYLICSAEKLHLQAIYAAPFFNEKSTGPADGMEKSYQEILNILTLMGKDELKKSVYKGSTDYLPDEETAVESPAAARIIFECGAALVQLPCSGVVSEVTTTGPELDAYLKGKNRLCDYLVSTTKTEGRRCSNELAWSRVIWDITTVAWLLDERFMEDYLMPSPIPEYDGHYSVDPKRHLMRYVYHVNRDKVFSDLFTKLANFG